MNDSMKFTMSFAGCLIGLLLILLIVPIVFSISGAIVGAGVYLVWNFLVSPVFELDPITFFWQSFCVGIGLVILNGFLFGIRRSSKKNS